MSPGAISFLNSERSALSVLEDALHGARGFDVAVAYAKASGVKPLLDLGLPASSRFLIGTGFALTEPEAVVSLHRRGFPVQLFFGDRDVGPQGFHLKSLLVYRAATLIAITGSGNLTAGGIRDNIEQFVEQLLPLQSHEAKAHQARYESLWKRSIPLSIARRDGLWESYETAYEHRRNAERSARREVARRLSGMRKRSQEARKSIYVPGAAPGYLANTDPRWWMYAIENGTRNPAFWRPNVNRFLALQDGGYFLHIVNERDGNRLRAEDRLVVGYSRYRLGYRVLSSQDAWREYGRALGCSSYRDFDRLYGRQLGERFGLIELHAPIAFHIPPTLRQLDQAGVRFDRAIVSGRRLGQDELRTVFALAKTPLVPDV
jgi:HKD family nuclease